MSGITHFVADEYGHKVWFHVFIWMYYVWSKNV